MNLTKADIARRIADNCGFMKEEAAEVLENCWKLSRPGSSPKNLMV